MKKITIFCTGLLLLLATGCQVEQFAQWRGPDRNGIFPEVELQDQWPEEGPEIAWVFEGLGRGYAAPCVSETGIFVNGEAEGKSYLYALDPEGNLLWRSPNGEEFLGEGFSSTYPGSRSTPTLKDGLVYTTSGHGRIGCFDASDGSEKWARHILKDLKGELGYFGYSESLVVDEKHVYCFPGGSEINMAALDRHSGEVVWTSEVLRDTFAYGSMVPVELEDRDILIVTSRHYLVTIDRSDGSLLASYPLEGYEYDGEHCNTPVFADGYIYFVANDIPGQGSVKLKLSESGKKITEEWRNNKVLNNFGGLVVIDGKLFTTVKGNRLVALDPENGSISDTLKVSTGSIAFADDKFYCYGNNGTVNLVNYSPGSLAVGGTFKVREGSGQHFSHPVLANGLLFIRRGNALTAYRAG